MEPLTLLLILVVLALALAWAGHLVARQTWPTRRRIWRRRAILVEEEARDLGEEHQLEKPEVGMNDAAIREPVADRPVADDVRPGELEPTVHSAQAAPGGEGVPGENPPADDGRTRLQKRRAAGISQEDLDY